MKSIRLILLLCFMAGTAVAQVKPAKVKLKNDVDSVSYALGVSIGDAMSKSDLRDLNWELFKKGMIHVQDSVNALTVEQADMIIAAYISVLMEEKDEHLRAEEKVFFEKNRNEPGVMETLSGLQYKVVTMGSGPKPDLNDMVTIHYHGTLPDGTVFDSSVQRFEPIELALEMVIPGWQEGVQLMPQGSKFIFYIPSDLAYGAEGAGEDIPGYSPLIFEVELLQITPVE